MPLLLPAPALALSHIPLSLEETVQESDAVFVGRVVSRQSRWADERQKWMWTDVTLRVEDGISGTRTGDTVTVRYWGGRIGGESMGIAGLDIPRNNARYVMLLKPASTAPRFSPVAGEVDGLFTVSDSPNGPTVQRGDGGPVVLPTETGPAGSPPQGTPAPPPPPSGLLLSEFTAWLRSNLAPLRARPPRPRPAGFLSEEQVFPGQPAPEEGGGVIAPASPTLPQSPAGDASVPNSSAGTPDYEPATPGPVQVRGGVKPLYSFLNAGASLPIVFNQLPATMTPWASVDQHQMSKWNYYAGIFQVRGTPTGTFAWKNDRFDMCGFPSSATMQSEFGAPWGSDTLGICYWRKNSSNVLIEADVALNPTISWTLDEEAVYSGTTSSASFRSTVFHELGHAWGLNHNFRYYSVMNYVPGWMRPLRTLPFMDDAEAIRALYPGAAIPRSDVAVYLVNRGTANSDGDFKDWVESTFPASARAGTSFTLSNFHMENTGTTTRNVVVEWYLAAQRNFTAPHYTLRTANYGSLLRFQAFAPATTSLPVPLSTPEGSYYVAGFIDNDEGASQAVFPIDNNRTFSRSKITISQVLASVSPTAISVRGGQTFTARPTLHGASNGARVTMSGALSSLDYPSSVTIPSGFTNAAVSITAHQVAVPTTANLTFSYGGVSKVLTVNITPSHTMADARKALQAAGGLRSLTVNEAYFLDTHRAGTSANRVDVLDALAIIRRVRGLAP